MSQDRHSEEGVCVALTGGIACGKTEAARVLEEDGAVIWDADEVAHALLTHGTAVFEAVARRFGPGILRPDGGLDRRRIAERVFGNPAEREALNAMIHPEVIRLMRAWRVEARANHRKAAAVIPLLHEVGEDGGWDAVVCVAAPEAAMLERLRRRGLSEQEARQRMEAQMPVREKAARSDYTIENSGSLEDLRAATRKVWLDILRKKETYHG